MNNGKVGERVSFYSMNARGIGTIVEIRNKNIYIVRGNWVGGHSLSDSFRLAFHRTQLLRLVKKKRRIIWVNPVLLTFTKKTKAKLDELPTHESAQKHVRAYKTEGWIEFREKPPASFYLPVSRE